MKKNISSVLILLFLAFTVSVVVAQVPASTPPAVTGAVPAAAPIVVMPVSAPPPPVPYFPPKDPNSTTPPTPVLPAASWVPLTPEELKQTFRGSFFLTPIEIAIIQKALEGKVTKSPTIEADDNRTAIPQRRVISVGGVLWRSNDDWIVWMNGQKVTPKTLLKEIVDIKVENSSYVALKWYDIGLNMVISITLRPHQTYDITTGILLPG